MATTVLLRDQHKALPSKAAQTGKSLWIVSLFASLSIIGYTIYWFPAFQDGKYLNRTSHQVDAFDQVYLVASIAPFFLLLFSSHLMDAFHIKANTLPLWLPRWTFDSTLFAAWSIGDLLTMAIVFGLNLVWWLVPVLSRINNNPDKTDQTLRIKLDHLFGWAAMAGMFDVGFAIVMAVRENSFAKTLVGKDAGQFHRGLKYHIVFGYSAAIMLTIHTGFSFF